MPATGDNLRIDPARLWDSLEEMAKIGPGVAGGCNRQTLTDADSEGRHLFKRWCEAAGMSMGVDTMGNMFATRAGTDPDGAAGLHGLASGYPADGRASMTAFSASSARWRWCAR
jgi:acetylornithine deacetylase/succinyl-diaminopimelate desuccinylase-like protein